MADPEVQRYALRSFDTSYGRLKSLFQAFCWENGVAIATCSKGKCPDDAVPVAECACGLYGHLTLDLLVGDYRVHARKNVAVFEAEGRTIIGPRGLKTKAARIQGYWCATLTEKDVYDHHAPEAKHFACIDELLKAYHFPAYDPTSTVEGPFPLYRDTRRNERDGDALWADLHGGLRRRAPLPATPPARRSPPTTVFVPWGSSWNNIASLMSGATNAGVAAVQQATGYTPPNGKLLPDAAPKGTVVCTSGRRPHNPPIGLVIYQLDTQELMVYSKPDRHPATWKVWTKESLNRGKA